jgi:hypothetical protein
LDNAGRGDNGFGTVPALASTLDYGNSNFDLRQRIAGNIFCESPLAGRILVLRLCSDAAGS